MLCPGQGAQFVGMGKAWYDASPEARAVFDKADAFMGDKLGTGREGRLSTLCFEGPAERLNQTDVSQPAIYVCSVAAFAGQLAKWGAASAAEAGVHATAGLSLGEYTALHIAGCFSFEEGLNLVTIRGRAMQDAADAVEKTPNGGAGSGMVALIGADEAQAQLVCEKALADGGTGEVLVPANFNAPGQVVVSGHSSACERAVRVAGEMGLRATALAVAGAFHSPLMAPAADRLRIALARTPISQPQCVVMSNVTGEPHAAPVGRPAGTAGLGGVDDAIRVKLVEQLTHAVRWADGCSALIRLTQQWTQTPTWHELAPGKTLAGLMRRVDKSVKVETHDEP